MIYFYIQASGSEHTVKWWQRWDKDIALGTRREQDLERAEKMRLEELGREHILKEKELQLKFDLERFKVESGLGVRDESNDSINPRSVTSNLRLKKKKSPRFRS
ncbi:hypothetical protein TNCV_1067801 [Trichonephila clavipes]|nr:hypothetical protein TNCV_1067801 [Trichonephila clavipes]